MYVVLMAGSKSDDDHVLDIISKLKENSVGKESLHISIQTYITSAHRKPTDVLDVLKKYEDKRHVLFITVAGMSNALSGMVAANTNHITIACPNINGMLQYMTDIHSTLRMPSYTPVLTIISTLNCALAALRILESWK